eukprot:scaffold62339_cov33-Tisochrysis_lutea.AAC.2
MAMKPRNRKRLRAFSSDSLRSASTLAMACIVAQKATSPVASRRVEAGALDAMRSNSAPQRSKGPCSAGTSCAGGGGGGADVSKSWNLAHLRRALNNHGCAIPSCGAFIGGTLSPPKTAASTATLNMKSPREPAQS